MEEPAHEPSRPAILIVEDHLETRLFLEMLLGDLYEVHAVESADEALQLVRQYRFDLFLFDIALRDEIDGTRLAEIIQTIPACSETPMIAMSAHQLREPRQFYLEHGFDEFLGKPFFPEELLAMIARLID